LYPGNIFLTSVSIRPNYHSSLLDDIAMMMAEAPVLLEGFLAFPGVAIESTTSYYLGTGLPESPDIHLLNAPVESYL